MAQPDRYQGPVNAGLKQLHGRGVAQHVRRHALFRERGTLVLSRCDVYGQGVLHGIGAESPAVTTGEQEARLVATLFIGPGFQHSHCRSGQRRASFLSSFALTANVCATAEQHIFLSQPGDFGEAVVPP